MNIRGTKIVKAESKSPNLFEDFAEAHPILGKAKVVKAESKSPNSFEDFAELPFAYKVKLHSTSL